MEERLGPVEVLCNNAGIGAATPVADLRYEDWDRILDVNLGGVVNGVRTVLPRMLARGGPGHVVNTASGAGLVATTNLTYTTTNLSYTTSKFAVVGMTESLRQQQALLAAGIGVSVLCPGLVSTDVVWNSADHADSPDQATLELGQRFLREYGLDPDVVGEQVVAAVRESHLHMQTDRYIEPLFEERTRLLTESLPPETERDRAPSLTPPMRQ